VELTSLHLLLTYVCTHSCDHCFVWGSPEQSGTMTLDMIDKILDQGEELGTVRSIYFEGGEPFLFYAVLLRGIQMANERGFKAGIVSNSYWATDERDALEWLRPLQGLISDLCVSSDLFHADEMMSAEVKHAQVAAEKLGISTGVLSIAQPEVEDAASVRGQLPTGESQVMCRGRATRTLIERFSLHPWETFDECRFENLVDPGRIHIDPLGHIHICQGISIGNLFQNSLAEICKTYDPDTHPIVGPILDGGPAELVRHYDLPLRERYVDACHLCYLAREMLRPQFPEILAPDQMYGVF
jgi:MoaA/NifB/PqqE/SkfB family radical SAM enzyme